MASKKEDFDDFDDLSEFDDLDNFNFEAKEPEPGEPAYRKMLIGKYLGAVGGGVLSGIKKAAESELSESADVVSEIGDWGSDLSETWDTLKDATTEVIEQGRKTVKQLMPSLRKLMPQRIYGKLEDYLSDVDLNEEKQESPEKAQERMENESIQSVLGEVFSEQLAEDKRENIDEKIEETKKSALATKRFAAEYKTLTSIDQRIYQLSTFMAGPYTNYLKKSLEVSYRQYYTQKGILQLHKATFKMVEAKLEELKLNTSLPDANKADSTKKRLPKKMANQNIINNFRENLLGRIKEAALDRLNQAKEGLGTLSEFLGMGADFGMTKEYTWHDIFSGALKMGVGSVANKALSAVINQNDKTRNFLELGARRLRTNLYSALAGPVAQKLKNGPGWISWLADMIPKGSSWEDTKVVDDFLGRRDKAAQFDELTKRSIVEIIPAHLERVGDMVEALKNAIAPDQPVIQRTFDHETGMLVDANVIKRKMLESYVGTQAQHQAESRANLGFLTSAMSENKNGVAVSSIRKFEKKTKKTPEELAAMSKEERDKAEAENKKVDEYNKELEKEARALGVTNIDEHNAKVATYEENFQHDLDMINEHRGGLIIFMNYVIHAPNSIWHDASMFRKVFSKLDELIEKLQKRYEAEGASYPEGCDRDWPFSESNIDDWKDMLKFEGKSNPIAGALKEVYQWDPLECLWTIKLLRLSLFRRSVDKDNKVSYLVSESTMHTFQDHIHRMQTTDDAQRAEAATAIWGGRGYGYDRWLKAAGLVEGNHLNAPALNRARQADIQVTKDDALADTGSLDRKIEKGGMSDDFKVHFKFGPEFTPIPGGNTFQPVNIDHESTIGITGDVKDFFDEHWQNIGGWVANKLGRVIGSGTSVAAGDAFKRIADLRKNQDKSPYYYVVSLQRVSSAVIQVKLVFGKFNEDGTKVIIKRDKDLILNIPLDKPQTDSKYAKKLSSTEQSELKQKLKSRIPEKLYFPDKFEADEYPDGVKGEFVGWLSATEQFKSDLIKHHQLGDVKDITEDEAISSLLVQSPRKRASAAAAAAESADAPATALQTIVRPQGVQEVHSNHLEKSVVLLSMIQQHTKNLATLVAEQVAQQQGNLSAGLLDDFSRQMQNVSDNPTAREQLRERLTTQHRNSHGKLSSQAFKAMLDSMSGPTMNQQAQLIWKEVAQGYFNPQDVFIGLDENNRIIYRIDNHIFVQELRKLGKQQPEYAAKMREDVPVTRAMAMMGVGSYIKLDREALITDALDVAKSLQGKDPLAPESIKLLSTELNAIKRRERHEQQREAKRERSKQKREQALDKLRTKGAEFQQSIEAARAQAAQLTQTEAQQQLPPPEPATEPEPSADVRTAVTGDNPLDEVEPEKFALEKAASWLHDALSGGIDSAEELYDKVAALPEDMAKSVARVYMEHKDHFNKEFRALGGVAASAMTDLKDWASDKYEAGVKITKTLSQHLKERYQQKKQQLEESWQNSRTREALHNVGDNVKAVVTQVEWGRLADEYATQFRETMEDYQKKLSETLLPKFDELVENTKSIPAAAWYSFKSSPMAIEFFDKYYSPLKGWLHEKVEDVKKWALGGPGAMTGIRGFLRNMLSKPSTYRLKAMGWSRRTFDVTKLKPNDLIHIGWFPTFCGGLKLEPTKELYDLFEAALKDYRKLLDLARAGNKGDDNLAVAMDIMARTNDPANGSYAALAKYLMDHEIKSEDVENTLKAYYRLNEIHGPSAEDPDTIKHALRDRWLKLKRYVSQIEFHGLAGVVAKGVKLGYKIIKHLPLRALLGVAKKIAMKGVKTVTKLGHKIIQHIKHSRTLFKLLDIIGIRLPERAKVITKAPWWEEYCKQFNLDPEDMALITLLDNAANAYARVKQFGADFGSDMHYHFLDCADKVRQQLIYENKLEDLPLTSAEGQQQHTDVCQMCVLYWRGRDNGPAVMTDMMQRQLDKIDKEINDTLTANTVKPPRGTGLVRLLLGKKASSIYQKLMGDTELKLSDVSDKRTADMLRDGDDIVMGDDAKEVPLQSGQEQVPGAPQFNHEPGAKCFTEHDAQGNTVQYWQDHVTIIDPDGNYRERPYQNSKEYDEHYRRKNWLGDKLHAGANIVSDLNRAGVNKVKNLAQSAKDWLANKTKTGADLTKDLVKTGLGKVKDLSLAGVNKVVDAGKTGADKAVATSRAGGQVLKDLATDTVAMTDDLKQIGKELGPIGVAAAKKLKKTGVNIYKDYSPQLKHGLHRIGETGKGIADAFGEVGLYAARQTAEDLGIDPDQMEKGIRWLIHEGGAGVNKAKDASVNAAKKVGHAGLQVADNLGINATSLKQGFDWLQDKSGTGVDIAKELGRTTLDMANEFGVNTTTLKKGAGWLKNNSRLFGRLVKKLKRPDDVDEVRPDGSKTRYTRDKVLEFDAGGNLLLERDYRDEAERRQHWGIASTKDRATVVTQQVRDRVWTKASSVIERIRNAANRRIDRYVRQEKRDIVKVMPDGTQLVYKKDKVVIIDKNNGVTVRDYQEGEKERLFPEDNKANALLVRQQKIKERFQQLKERFPNKSDDKLMKRAREEILEETGSNRLLSLLLGEKRAHKLREARVGAKRKAAEFARKSLDKLKGGVAKVGSMGMNALRSVGGAAGQVLKPIGNMATSGLGMLGNAIGMLPGMSHIVGTGALLNPVTAGALALAAGSLATYKGIKGSTVAQTAKDLGLKDKEVTARDRWARGIGQGLTFGLGGKWATKVSDELIENSALSALPRLYEAFKHEAGEEVAVTDKDLDWARRKLKDRISDGDRQAELDLQQFESYVKQGARYEAMKLVKGGVGSNLLKTVGTIKPGLGLAVYGAKKFGQWAGQAYGLTDTTKAKVASLRKELAQRAAKNKAFEKVLREYDEKVKLGALADAVAFGEQALRSPFMQKLTNFIGYVINKDQLGGADKPLTAEEIKQVLYKYDLRIKKGDKMAATDKKWFLQAIEKQDWEGARAISGKVHDSWAMSSTKLALRATGIGALVSSMFSNEDRPLRKPQIEQRIKKFEEQIKYWNERNPARAERCKQDLIQFQDAVNSGDWPTANRLAKIDTRSDMVKGLAWLGRSVISTINSDRPMGQGEIDKYRRKIANMVQRANEKGNEAAARQLKLKLEQFDSAVINEDWQKARRLSNTADTGILYLADRMLSNFLYGLNDTPMTAAEITRYRNNMQQRINSLHQSTLADKDTRILRLNKELSKFEDAVAAEDWPTARRISKQNKTGLYTGAIKVAWNLTKDWIFGSNDTPMTAKEITGFRDKMNADIARCEKFNPQRANMLRNKLAKFEDAAMSGNWTRARTIANMPNSGIFGMATNAIIGMAKSSLAWLFGGDDKPMTPQELELARSRLNDLAQQGNPVARQRLDAFEQAVSEGRWTRARKIADIHQLGILKRFSRGLGNVWDSAFTTTINKTPMTEEELERYRYRFNMEIASGNKVARNKAVQFEKFVKQGKWADARAVADLNHIKKSWFSRLGTFMGQVTGLVDIPAPKRGLHDFSLKSMGVDATLGSLVGRLRGYKNYREFESALETALEKRGTDEDTVEKIIQAMRDTYCNGASFLSPLMHNAKYYQKLLDKGEANLSKEDEQKIRKETATQLTELRVTHRADMKFNVKTPLSSVYIKLGQSGKNKELALKDLIDFAKYYTFKEMFDGVREALRQYTKAHGLYTRAGERENFIRIVIDNLEDQFEPEDTGDEELEDNWQTDQDFYLAHVELYYSDLAAASDNPKTERKRLFDKAGIIESGTITLESGLRVPSPPKKISQCAHYTYPELVKAIADDIDSAFGTTLGFGGDKARYDWAMATLEQLKIGLDDGTREGKPLYTKAKTYADFIGLMFNRVAYLAKLMGLTKGKKVNKFMEAHRRRNWIVSKVNSAVMNPPDGDDKEKWRIAFTIAGCFCGCLLDDRKLLPEDPEIAGLCTNSEKYFKALVSGTGVDTSGSLTNNGAANDTRTLEEIKKESEAKADTTVSAELKKLPKKKQELPESVDYLKQTGAMSAAARDAIAVVAGKKLRLTDLIKPERYANLAEAKADLLQSLQQRGLSAKAAEDALGKWISLVTGGKAKLEHDPEWWRKTFLKPTKPKPEAAPTVTGSEATPASAAAEPEAKQALPAPASKAAAASVTTDTNADEDDNETEQYIKEGLELLKTDTKLQQRLQETTGQPANIAKENLITLLKTAVLRAVKQNHKDDFLGPEDLKLEMDFVDGALRTTQYAPMLKQLLAGKTQEVTASPSPESKPTAAPATTEPEAKQALPAPAATVKPEETVKPADKPSASNSIGARYLEAALQDAELKQELEAIAQPDYKYDRNADAIQAVKKAANRAIGQKTKNIAIATIHRKATMSYIDRQHFSFVGLCTKLGVTIPDSVAATEAPGLDVAGSRSAAIQAQAAAKPEAKQALPAPPSPKVAETTKPVETPKSSVSEANQTFVTPQAVMVDGKIVKSGNNMGTTMTPRLHQFIERWLKKAALETKQIEQISKVMTIVPPDADPKVYWQSNFSNRLKRFIMENNRGELKFGEMSTICAYLESDQAPKYREVLKQIENNTAESSTTDAVSATPEAVAGTTEATQVLPKPAAESADAMPKKKSGGMIVTKENREILDEAVRIITTDPKYESYRKATGRAKAANIKFMLFAIIEQLVHDKYKNKSFIWRNQKAEFIKMLILGGSYPLDIDKICKGVVGSAADAPVVAKPQSRPKHPPVEEERPNPYEQQRAEFMKLTQNTATNNTAIGLTMTEQQQLQQFMNEMHQQPDMTSEQTDQLLRQKFPELWAKIHPQAAAGLQRSMEQNNAVLTGTGLSFTGLKAAIQAQAAAKPEAKQALPAPSPEPDKTAAVEPAPSRPHPQDTGPSFTHNFNELQAAIRAQAAAKPEVKQTLPASAPSPTPAPAAKQTFVTPQAVTTDNKIVKSGNNMGTTMTPELHDLVNARLKEAAKETETIRNIGIVHLPEGTDETAWWQNNFANRVKRMVLEKDKDKLKFGDKSTICAYMESEQAPKFKDVLAELHGEKSTETASETAATPAATTQTQEATFKESPQEYAMSFDRYGRRLAFRKGNHDNVRLPTKPGGTIVHTHPQGTGPSFTDMQAATQAQQAKLVTIPMNNNSELLSPLNSLDQTNAVQLATLQQIAQGLQLLINVMQQHNQSLDQHVIRTAETTFQSAVQMSQQLTSLNQQRLRKAEYQAGPVEVNKR